MRACEVKGLRWRDVDLMEHTLTVRRSKTEAGERLIPLNADAMAAILELRERAKVFSGKEPDHFVFPACEGGRIDPTLPQKSWRSAWRRIARAAGLRDLRFHDLRHHAITELAESQASDQTIMAIAGHVSHQMFEHYSHVRLEAKRRALDTLSSRASGGVGKASHEGSYGTKKVTSGVLADVPPPPSERKEWSALADDFRTLMPRGNLFRAHLSVRFGERGRNRIHKET